MVTNIIRDICRPKARKYVPPHVNIFLGEVRYQVDVLDYLGVIVQLLSVGLRLALKAGLAALEWVQYWQCSLSNVGNRLSYR